MNRPKIPLNRLPCPKRRATFQSQHFRPGKGALAAYDPLAHQDPDPDPSLVIEAMQDCLLSNMASLQDLDMPPMLEDEPLLQPMFYPTPGRCLWSWVTLIHLKEVRDDPDLVNPEPMLNLALKPSELYPETLQGITPRLAMQLAGLGHSDIGHFGEWLVDQGILTTRIHRTDVLYFLAVLPYGGGLDGKLDAMLLPQMEPPNPPRNSKRTLAQHYAIEHPQADPSDTMMQAIMRHPPLSVELGPAMHKAFLRAVKEVPRWAALAKELNPDASPYFHEIWDRALSWDLHKLEVAVVPHYLTGSWDFHLLYTEELSPHDHLVLAMVRAMAQWLYRAAIWRYQQPSATLALSLATGISPAIFVRAAIAQLERTGLSFLGENHIDTIAQRVRELRPSRSAAAQSRREALIEELDDLQAEYLQLQDSMPLAKIDEGQRLTGTTGMQAWGIGKDVLV